MEQGVKQVVVNGELLRQSIPMGKVNDVITNVSISSGIKRIGKTIVCDEICIFESTVVDSIVLFSSDVTMHFYTSFEDVIYLLMNRDGKAVRTACLFCVASCMSFSCLALFL